MNRNLDAAIAEGLGYEVQVKHRGYDVVYLIGRSGRSEWMVNCWRYDRVCGR